MSDRMVTDSKVIDGKAFAAKLREKIAARVKTLQSQHSFTPGLAVVLVGFRITTRLRRCSSPSRPESACV